MRKIYLALLSSSFGWVLAFQVPAFAVDANQGGAKFSNLSTSHLEFAQVDPSSPNFNCSQEEREDALSKFGCSCSTCISAVQQLRGQAPLRQLLFRAGQNWQDSAHPHQVLGNTLGR